MSNQPQEQNEQGNIQSRPKHNNFGLTIEQHKDAALNFKSSRMHVIAFEMTDPFSKNVLTGYICKRNGFMGGSLFIFKVNGKPTKQLIYGSPNIKKLPAKFQFREENTNPDKYFLSHKWNGTSIFFFKYTDENGSLFISAKTKNSPFVQDNDYGKYLTETRKALELSEHGDIKKSPLLKEFVKDNNLQGIAFELCGSDIPQLIKYDFQIALKPSFTVSIHGKMQPISNQKHDIGPKAFKDDVTVIAECAEIQKKCTEQNKAYRAKNQIDKPRYQLGHFEVEGYILHLLDKDGYIIDRVLYKVKALDINEVYLQKFDDKMREQVRGVYKKFLQGKEEDEQISEVFLQKELGLNEQEWSKYKKQIVRYATTRLDEKGDEKPFQPRKRFRRGRGRGRGRGRRGRGRGRRGRGRGRGKPAINENEEQEPKQEVQAEE